jgi:hypothetical protein
MANTNVTAAAITTPHRTPIRNVRIIFLIGSIGGPLTATMRSADFAVPLRSCILLPLLDECFPRFPYTKDRSSASSRFLASAPLMEAASMGEQYARNFSRIPDNPKRVSPSSITLAPSPTGDFFWGPTTNGHEWTLMFCCSGRFVACSIGAAVETQFANDFRR